MTDQPEPAALVDELSALHVWPQSVACEHADILTPRQIEKLYEVGKVADRAKAALATAIRERDAARALLRELRGCRLGPRTVETIHGPPIVSTASWNISGLTALLPRIDTLLTDGGDDE